MHGNQGSRACDIRADASLWFPRIAGTTAQGARYERGNWRNACSQTRVRGGRTRQLRRVEPRQAPPGLQSVVLGLRLRLGLLGACAAAGVPQVVIQADTGNEQGCIAGFLGLTTWCWQSRRMPYHVPSQTAGASPVTARASPHTTKRAAHAPAKPLMLHSARAHSTQAASSGTSAVPRVLPVHTSVNSNPAQGALIAHRKQTPSARSASGSFKSCLNHTSPSYAQRAVLLAAPKAPVAAFPEETLSLFCVAHVNARPRQYVLVLQAHACLSLAVSATQPPPLCRTRQGRAPPAPA